MAAACPAVQTPGRGGEGGSQTSQIPSLNHQYPFKMCAHVYVCVCPPVSFHRPLLHGLASVLAQ